SIASHTITDPRAVGRSRSLGAGHRQLTLFALDRQPLETLPQHVVGLDELGHAPLGGLEIGLQRRDGAVLVLALLLPGRTLALDLRDGVLHVLELALELGDAALDGEL